MRKPLIIFGIIALGYFMINIHYSNNFTPNNSQLFYNGNILTMENNEPIIDAVYIENGIINKIGDEEKLRKLSREGTDFINLNGHTLMPGFIDPHTHPVASTFLHGMIDLSGFKHKTKEDVWAYFEKSVSQYEPN